MRSRNASASTFEAFEAFEALGRGPAPAALPALNRPEVLFILGTGQTQVLTIWPVPEELAHVGEDPAAAAETFGAVQAPKQVIGIDALPVTALGKPAKKALRVQFWGEGVLSVG